MPRHVQARFRRRRSQALRAACLVLRAMPHDATSAVATRLYPRPWDDPWMELTHGSWFGISALRDLDGRALGEANTVPLSLRPKFHADEWRECPYRDSRHGRLFSVAALRQVTGAWPGVLYDLWTLRKAMLEAEGWTTPLRPVQLLVLARTVTSYPSLLARRRHQPLADGRLPPRLAASYKVAAGVHMAVEDLLRRDRNIERVWSADELLAHIETAGLFIATSSRVCGGPKKMVRELLELLISGTAPPGVPATFFTEESEARVLGYGRACATIELLYLWRQLMLALLLQRLARSERDDLLRSGGFDRPEGVQAIPRALFELGVAVPPLPIAVADWEGAKLKIPKVEQAFFDRVNGAFRSALRFAGRSALPVDGWALSLRSGELRRYLRRRGRRLVIREGRAELAR
ncbi:MAG: hypothetical protein AAGF12_26510 [Myxococcota bacterium]